MRKGMKKLGQPSSIFEVEKQRKSSEDRMERLLKAKNKKQKP